MTELPGENVFAYLKDFWLEKWINFDVCILGRNQSIRPQMVLGPVKSCANCNKFLPLWIFKFAQNLTVCASS